MVMMMLTMMMNDDGEDDAIDVQLLFLQNAVHLHAICNGAKIVHRTTFCIGKLY